MKHADWVEVLDSVATKHDLLLSDALINFADDVWDIATKAERQAHAMAKEIETPTKPNRWVATIYFDGKPSEVHGLFTSEKDALDWVETNYDGWDASVVQPLIQLTKGESK